MPLINTAPALSSNLFTTIWYTRCYLWAHSFPFLFFPPPYSPIFAPISPRESTLLCIPISVFDLLGSFVLSFGRSGCILGCSGSLLDVPPLRNFLLFQACKLTFWHDVMLSFPASISLESQPLILTNYSQPKCITMKEKTWENPTNAPSRGLDLGVPHIRPKFIQGS